MMKDCKRMKRLPVRGLDNNGWAGLGVERDCF
jgi:hypothetical protein